MVPAVLLGFLTACSAASQVPEAQLREAPAPPQVQIGTPLQAAGASALDRLPQVAERTVLSVVNISTEKTVRVQQRMPFPFFFGPQGPQGEPPEQRQEGRGSGVIVSAEGLVLTNNHVVGGADEILVTLSDGREFEAEVVGTDSHSDLAVVRLQDPPQNLVPLPYGDSADLRLGEVVLAIGNPFGIGQTVTMGIVSAKGRNNLGIVDYEDFIQTDAAINPGNSGGALVNLDGELVGINTAIFSRSGGNQGVGFAIPVSMAQRIAEDLLDDGRVDRGFLGVMIQDLDGTLAEAMGLENVDGGVIIADVTEGSAAQDAGFERGDVVLEFNDQPVEDVARFRARVADAGANERFSALVLREGKRRKITGKLGALDGDEPEVAASDETPSRVRLGVALAPLTPPLAQRLGLPDRISEGVVIEQVQPGAPAAEAGLRPGDVLLQVNRRDVAEPSDVTEALDRDEDQALLLVYRRGATQYVVVELD